MLKITRRKNTLQKDSINCKIVTGIFDGTFKSIDGIHIEDRKKYQNSISHLRKIKLLNINNSRFFLTDYGIWIAVCAKLNISFFALWIIADMYVLEKYSRQHNTSGNYHIGIIERRFEDTISQYSFKKSITSLLRQNLIFRISPKFYKLHSMKFENLKAYEKHLIKLQKHTCQLSIQCLEKMTEDVI